VRYPILFRNLLIIFCFILNSAESHSTVCLPKIIKNYKELEEKVDQVCKSGDKILIKFDVKIKAEDLILSYCNLKYTVITNDQIKLIQKRGSANYLICIYEPLK
tara:strand:+ start:19 stop:330 length:312 start_codon:yes stop_codon:yes gene_type:complete